MSQALAYRLHDLMHGTLSLECGQSSDDPPPGLCTACARPFGSAIPTPGCGSAKDVLLQKHVAHERYF